MSKYQKKSATGKQELNATENKKAERRVNIEHGEWNGKKGEREMGTSSASANQQK